MDLNINNLGEHIIRYISEVCIFPLTYYLVSLLLGAIVYLIVKMIVKDRKKSIILGTITTYLFLVLSSTVLVRMPKKQYTYELLPFWSYIEIFHGDIVMLVENILNIILLIPVGVLIGRGFEIKTRNVVVIGIVISGTIEFLQLITKRGLFEFDDILHNTIGCVIGYVVYRWIEKRRKKTSE